jgi:hypothetical protein
MEEENMDNQDALNLESVQDTNLENEPDDEAAKLKDYASNQKIRAEKAEREIKELKAKLSKQAERETPKNDETTEKKSNEPDYAKEAFLEQRGVAHPDDKKIVYDEAKRLNLPLTDVLGMEHIKAKLKSVQTQREAESGMPSGGGKGGSGVAKNSVDYWVNRKKADGTYETPEDTKLAGEVIKKRMEQEESANKFSEIMFS